MMRVDKLLAVLLMAAGGVLIALGFLWPQHLLLYIGGFIFGYGLAELNRLRRSEKK